MNREQASRAWEMSEKDVSIICEEMGIDDENIPEDTVPVYVPERINIDDPHRYYIYLLDAISNQHVEIQGIDKDILETCVCELKGKRLIILKRGADPDSLDYHDYVTSAERAAFNDWYGSIIKDSMQ